MAATAPGNPMWESSAELRHGLVNGSGRSARFPLMVLRT
jgi:hypothetical protein